MARDMAAERRASAGGWAVWIVLTALAELLGVGLGAVWWGGADRLNPEPTGFPSQLVMLALKALSGVVEGAVLGVVQASLMRRRLPGLSIRRWSLATCAVAVAGWAVGSSFSVFGGGGPGGGFDPDPLLTVALAAGFGLAVGTLFGGVQALALGGLGVRRWPWVIGNAAGWSLGLPAIYLAASGAIAGPVWLLGAGGGLIAGAVVGLATALAFAAMTRRSAAHH